MPHCHNDCRDFDTLLKIAGRQHTPEHFITARISNALMPSNDEEILYCHANWHTYLRFTQCLKSASRKYRRFSALTSAAPRREVSNGRCSHSSSICDTGDVMTLALMSFYLFYRQARLY